MNPEVRYLRWSVWGFLILVAVTISGLFLSSLIFKSGPSLPVYGTVPDFTLTNQLGRPISRANFHGQIWVADIIFTRCPGPCLQMTRKMKEIEAALPGDGSVRLVSLTADPQYDLPGVLQSYAARFQVDSNRWSFLTGLKKQVYDLALQGLKLAVEENPDAVNQDDRFIHSTRFVVVDRHGNLRGTGYDGSEPAAVPGVLRAVRDLLKEP